MPSEQQEPPRWKVWLWPMAVARRFQPVARVSSPAAASLALCRLLPLVQVLQMLSL